MASPPTDFCFPVRVLENDRVKVTPFLPEIHQAPLFEATKADGERLYHFLPFGPFKTVEEANEWYNARIGADPLEFLYAVYVKHADGTEELSGTVGLLSSSVAHSATEIGFVMTVPKFQRSFVTKNAVGLLMMYTLDPPPHGLGLRRVQWQAHATNKASVGAAKSMGFHFEGVIRWQRKLPMEKESSADVSRLEARTGEKEAPGRDTAMLSLCWDDWLEKREHVVKIMER